MLDFYSEEELKDIDKDKIEIMTLVVRSVRTGEIVLEDSKAVPIHLMDKFMERSVDKDAITVWHAMMNQVIRRISNNTDRVDDTYSVKVQSVGSRDAIYVAVTLRVEDECALMADYVCESFYEFTGRYDEDALAYYN